MIAKRILKAPLMVVLSDSETRKPTIAVLATGTVLTVLDQPNEAGLVSVRCEDQLITAFFADLLERSTEPPSASAAAG